MKSNKYVTGLLGGRQGGTDGDLGVRTTPSSPTKNEECYHPNDDDYRAAGASMPPPSRRAPPLAPPMTASIATDRSALEVRLVDRGG